MQLFGKIEDKKYCKKLRKQNKETIIFNKTGLLIDPIFLQQKLNGF